MQVSFFDIGDVVIKSFGLNTIADYINKHDDFKIHYMDGSLPEYVGAECRSYHGSCSRDFCFEFSGKGIMFADHIFNSYEPDEDVIVFTKSEFIDFVEDNIKLTDLEEAEFYDSQYICYLSEGCALGIYVNSAYEYEYCMYDSNGYIWDSGVWCSLDEALESGERFEDVVMDIADYYELEVLDYVREENI